MRTSEVSEGLAASAGPRRRRAAAIALALSLAACSRGPELPAMPERPPAPVRVVAAVSRDVPVYLDEIGRVAASETVALRPQVTGRVTEVRFAEGADVKKGDVLVVIDARPFQARLEAADAALAGAEAELERAKTSTLRPKAALERAIAARDWAKTEFERVERLLDSKAVARSDYDEKKSALAMAQAEVAQAEADLEEASPEETMAAAALRRAQAERETARLDLEYATIRSPIDGRAGRRAVDPGNVVTANQDVLVEIARTDPVHVDFSVAERHVPRVQQAIREGAASVEVRLPGADAARAGGKIFLENSVASATGTLALRATLANEDRGLWPGSYVKVRLVLATVEDAVLVPVAAQQTSPTGPFVYVVDAADVAEMRPVQPGQRHGELVAVQGVKPGDRVVTEGQLAVTPGGKVRVLPERETAHAESQR